MIAVLESVPLGVVVGVLLGKLIRGRLPEQRCWREAPHSSHEWEPAQREEPATCPGVTRGRL